MKNESGIIVRDSYSATLMAHCISHFPNEQTSLDIACALASAGARYLEVQFPFSDPFADGALIQSACAAALTEPDAFTVKKGFAMLKKLTEHIANNGKSATVFLMCYGNTTIAYGIKDFINYARQVGVAGIIIPDIPFDSDVGNDIQHACKNAGIHYIPVVVVTSERQRLFSVIQTLNPYYLYVSLRAGITGSKTIISDDIIRFLSDDMFSSIHILGGFGIQNAQQVQALSPYVHACVIGSAFVKVIMNAKENASSISQAVYHACKDLRKFVPASLAYGIRAN